MNALSSYVRDVLEPTWQQINFVPSRINRIAHVLQHNSSLSLDRVIPGGSYEKGTMLRYKRDVDVVLVFNKKPGVKRNWQFLMNRVYNALSDAYPNAEIQQGTNIAIHATFEQDDECNFDIVPSFSVNSPMQMAEVRTSKIYQGISSL
jgi:tRNA nucleotidyltransferase (CCA-adding enzyme)